MRSKLPRTSFNSKSASL